MGAPARLVNFADFNNECGFERAAPAHCPRARTDLKRANLLGS
jgi:hypothetical protein